MPISSAKQLSKPKAILLDWDNTVADSWAIIYESLKHTFTKFGMEPWSFEDVLAGRGNIHHSMRASFPAIFGDRWSEASDIYIGAFLECHLQQIKLLPNAESVLKAIKDKGIFQAIVSNKTGKHLRSEIKHLNLEHYFDMVVGATDAAKDKPHADPIYMALAKSELEVANYKDEVWMVGDTKTDVLAAIAAGAKPVLFADHWQLDDVTIENNEIYHIKNHAEFIEIVNSF